MCYTTTSQVLFSFLRKTPKVFSGDLFPPQTSKKKNKTIQRSAFWRTIRGEKFAWNIFPSLLDRSCIHVDSWRFITCCADLKTCVCNYLARGEILSYKHITASSWLCTFCFHIYYFNFACQPCETRFLILLPSLNNCFARCKFRRGSCCFIKLSFALNFNSQNLTPGLKCIYWATWIMALRGGACRCAIRILISEKCNFFISTNELRWRGTITLLP